MRLINLVKKIAVLVLILAVPGFLYYLLTVKGKNRYHPLQVYGPKTVATTGHRVHGKYIPDTIFHKIADFHLIDQDGKTVTSKIFDDRIFVIGFFYSHCPNVCTTINNNIDSLVQNYALNKMVGFASITVDPLRDTPAALKSYAGKFHTPPGKWMFLSGDTTSIYNLARNGLFVNALQAGKSDFIYSDKLVLIDENKRIRGYYSGASDNDIQRLNDEIKVLITEQLLKKEAPLY